MKILILTLGFDERFAIRALLRTGLGRGDEVLILLAEPLDERAIKAWRTVKEFISKYLTGVNIRSIKVNVSDFYGSIRRIAKELKASVNKESELIVNLSGGMRVLIVETLAALQLLKLEGVAEIEFENFMGSVTFPLKILRLNVKDEDKAMLKFILTRGISTLAEVANGLGISKSSAHRKVWRLANLGLLKVTRRGRLLLCEPTELTKSLRDLII